MSNECLIMLMSTVIINKSLLDENRIIIMLYTNHCFGLLLRVSFLNLNEQ